MDRKRRALRMRGQSRKRKKRKIPTAVIAAVLCVAGIAVVLFLFRLRKQESAEETTSAETPVIETASQAAETEPAEPSAEPETKPQTFAYFDKSLTDRQYELDEEAVPRDIEWGMPCLDEYGNAVFRQTDPAYPDHEMLRGIDVSKEQGPIDWYEVREARCDFVIICADEMFDEHYEGAYQMGMKIGVYAYSGADSPAEARKEARMLAKQIGDKKIDLFCAYVPEEMEKEGPYGKTPSEVYFQKADIQRNTRAAEAFCEEIRNAGLTPAVYASMRYESEMYDMSSLAGKYEIWYSNFEVSPSTPYPFSAWQYCLTGGNDGIPGPVHLDMLFLRPYTETEAEQKIFSYTQISPEDYETTTWVNYRKGNAAWNGDWAKIKAGGQEFMMFGCGICCLSNAVSTLTKEVVTPDKMYEKTRQNSSYHPESGRGAVSWSSLQTMCRYYALNVKLSRKPASYEAFVKEITAADTAIVLVDSANDRRLWWYTDGHYVGIWQYDPDTETVFVTDPSTHFNRQRVSLRDVYNALKTKSEYQYALISRP